MNRFLAINVSLFGLLSLLLLAACGGGGDGGGDTSATSKAADSGSSASSTTLSGRVADGYLTDARVFLDRNKNRVYDNGEPMAQSTPGGAYSLEVNPGEGELYPVVAQVIGGQTIDEDTGVQVLNGYLLETLPGRWGFISPLTTMVKQESDKNPSLSVQQIEIAVRSKLGIADSVSLFSDYIAPGNVHAALLAEYGRAHTAAKVIANLMGSLRAGISQNLGGIISDAEQSLVSYMISDQILWQAPLIEQALVNERNQGLVVNVSALSTAIVEEINTDGLDAEVMVLYEQRLEQNTDTWDMQPPRIQSQSPAADDTAAVNAIIAISFDELLDETLLDSGIIELSGPQGPVSGSLNYDPEYFRLTFTPNQFLLPFSNYQVTVKKGLADTLGNLLADDITWAFTTIFDQLPPALPDF